MPRSRRILLTLMLLGATTALPASATSLGGLGPERSAGGDAIITSCDDAVGASYQTQGGDITSVTVSGLADPACEGGSLTLHALDAGGTSIASAGPATVTTDADTADNSLTLSLSAQPKADLVDATAVSISGP